MGSLLKLYLRELPEPVVPWTQYQDFLDSTLMLDAATAAVRNTFTKTICQMSTDSLNNCNLINPRAKKSWRNKSAFCQKWTTTSWVTSAGTSPYKSQIGSDTDRNKNKPWHLYIHICYFRFLFEVQQKSKVNKMSVENLATVMGVNLFKPQVEDAISMMKGQLSS